MSHFLPYSLHPSKQLLFLKKANTLYFPLLPTKGQKKFNHPPVSKSHTEK